MGEWGGRRGDGGGHGSIWEGFASSVVRFGEDAKDDGGIRDDVRKGETMTPISSFGQQK